MRYQIKWLTADDRIERCVVEAADAQAARAQVDPRGALVLSVRRASLYTPRWQPRTTPRFALLTFTQELVTLLSAGFNLSEAIATLAVHAPARDYGQTLQTLDRLLGQGLRCSAAMATLPAAFPGFYVATVRASENSGDLEGALRKYLLYAEQADALKQRVIAALLYPALLLIVSALVLVFLLSYVVPKFSLVYHDLGDELPFATRALLLLGSLMREHGLLIALASLGALLTLAAAPVRTRLSRALLDACLQLPRLREHVHAFFYTRWFRVLGLLVQSGTPFVPALETALGLLPPSLRTRAERALGEIRAGRSVAESFAAQRLASGIAQRLIHVGERSGRLAEMLVKAAERDEQALARDMEWLTKLLAPALIAVMGVIIGGIVVFLYLPIFQLAEGIQ